MFRQLNVIVLIFLPNSVASDQKKLVVLGMVGFNDVGHANYRLFVKSQSRHLLVPEISNWPGQVEPINSALNDRHSSFLNSLFFYWILRFVVIWKGNILIFSTKWSSWISSIRTNNFILSNGDNDRSSSRFELCRSAFLLGILLFVDA